MDSDAGGAQDRVRVSDQEREAVVVRLNTATAEGRLTLAEFGERAGRAYAARTVADLTGLLDDLPAGALVPARPVNPATSGTPRSPSIQLTPIGSVKRSGRWRLSRDTQFGTVLGSVKLDLRQAEMAAAEVTLQVKTVVGSVKVWVPHGVQVEVEGRSIVGTRNIAEDAPTAYDAPVLRLVLDTVVGSVKIYRT